jgi:hypothetical protein
LINENGLNGQKSRQSTLMKFEIAKEPHKISNKIPKQKL